MNQTRRTQRGDWTPIDNFTLTVDSSAETTLPPPVGESGTNYAKLGRYSLLAVSGIEGIVLPWKPSHSFHGESFASNSTVTFFFDVRVYALTFVFMIKNLNLHKRRLKNMKSLYGVQKLILIRNIWGMWLGMYTLALYNEILAMFWILKLKNHGSNDIITFSWLFVSHKNNLFIIA